MFTPLFYLMLVVLAGLILVAAIHPRPSKLSKFELKRRMDLGDKDAETAQNRDELLVDIISLQRVTVSLLLILFVLLSVNVFGWLNGALIALFVTLEYGVVARLGFIKKVADNLYLRFETKIIRFIQKVPIVFKLIRNVSSDDLLFSHQLSSREELQNIIDNSTSVLTPDEKKLIVHGLSFADKTVDSIMTPRSVIDSIKNTEFLGPLVLNDLHQLGHSRLPVIKGDIDHIIGILNLKSLLSLDNKRSVTAEKAMDLNVCYIRQDQTLGHALAAFLRTHYHLFVVVNEFRETVGLLALEDVIEALIGQKIVDEFDAHDNLRAVALRNPRDNNDPKKRQDV